MSHDRSTFRAAFGLALLAVSAGTSSGGLAAQSACTFRNGSGVNPAGFACVSDPLIGTSWNTTVDIVTPQAAASAVVVFFGGPLAGLPLSFGELLCNPPMSPIDVAAGAHSIPIPYVPQLVGNALCAQAATLKLAPLRIQLQNALDFTIQAAGSERITVLVLADMGTGPLVPVSGAAVMLQGTDVASAAGLVQTTGAGGTALFVGVTGPFTVTAQADFPLGGMTRRVGGSLIDIAPMLSGSPPAGTIGVLLDLDAELTPPVNATLSGVVTNRPVLTGNQYLEVVAEGRGSVEFFESAFVDPTTGAYSMSIPSGAQLDCYVARRQDFTQFQPPILATLLAPGIGPTGPGTTLVRNFDFGSNAVVPWNVSTPFSVANKHPALSLSVQLLVVDSVNGVEFDLSFFDGSAAPSPILLPSVSHASFTGYRVDLDVDTFDPLGFIEAGQDCSRRLTTNPASVAFTLFSLPALLWPPHHAALTVPELESLTVQLLESATGSFGGNGVSLFWLEGSGPPGSGVDEVSWTILFRPGTTSFDLPRFVLPMFAPNEVVNGGLEQVRFQGLTVDYDTFFGPNLAANLSALETVATDECGSDIEFDLYLVP